MSEQDRVQHISEFGMRTNENDNSNVNLSKSAFEAWYDDGENDPLPDDYTILGKRYLYLGWQAATAEANKRIEGLESEIAELKNWKKEVIAVENEWDEQLIGKALNIQLGNSIRAYILPKINELQANNNDLREALEKAMNDEAGWYEIAKQALSATPAESLQAHDNEVIEKCAKSVKIYGEQGEYIANAIRELKGKQ